ncbi:hypothetical protein [Pseudonocardia ailaonensis]
MALDARSVVVEVNDSFAVLIKAQSVVTQVGEVIGSWQKGG